MSNKNTAKKSNGANTGAGKNNQKKVANKAAKTATADNQEIIVPDETTQPGKEIAEVTNNDNNVGAVAPAKKAAQAAKSKSKVVAQKKAVTKTGATDDKKVKLVSTCYHYYRNWLKEFMRSHGVSSARFVKAPESYNGHIAVLESEKVKGLKALETWNKQNPDTKEMFWDIKK